MTDSFNDNDVVRGRPLREPDAHGQAALLLVESLIHGMLARSLITLEEAMEIVDIAAEVKAEIGGDMGDSPSTLQASLTLLKTIRDSLNSEPR